MIRSILLASLFALILSACSEKPTEEMINETPAAEETTQESVGESAKKMVDKITNIEITGDESAKTNDLVKAAEEITGDKANN